MMHAAPTQVKITDYPYLMAMIVAKAMEEYRVPKDMVQKANRLLNKVSYQPRTLNEYAEAAFSTLLPDYPVDHVTIAHVIISRDPIWREEVFRLDQESASYGELRAFLNHVFSKDA